MVFRGRFRKLWQFLFLVLLLFFFCEYAIYYVTLLQCTWPALSVVKSDQKPLRVMLFADTHLLGYQQGHWFDKLRREWQMQRAFQACMTIHSPEVVFVLGDLFDEGKWCGDEEFADHLNRFRKMFAHSSDTDLQVVVGNHDVGFHYSITSQKMKRFQRSFQSSAVRMLNIRGNTFVALNSMAFEGDQCSLCRDATRALKTIKKELNCSKMRSENTLQGESCDGIGHFPYSKPIILQHFPMFRLSEENCTGPDSAPLHIKYEKFKPKYDCLSQDATDMLLNTLKPRLVIDGHTHYFCHRKLTDGTPEWTIPSFSWRNTNTPSFLLATISHDSYAINKCFLPQESTVISFYIGGGTLIVLWCFVQFLRHFRFTRRTRKTR